MIRLRDILLVLCIYTALIGGVMFPEVGAYFQSTPIYCLMLLLFLAFLPIRLHEIVTLCSTSWATIGYLFVIKSLILPAMVYVLFAWAFPSYATGALLLTSVSTAVAAPFFATMLQANIPLVLALVVLTSLATPITLPLLLKVLVGTSIHIDILPMIKMLTMVVLLPVLASETLNTLSAKISGAIFSRQFPISLIAIFIANMGIFSEYAPFFRQQPRFVFTAILLAVVLALIYAASALLLFWKSEVTTQVSAVIIVTFVNSFLALVFSARFFGPLETSLCAMYSVPIFFMIIPLRIFQSLRSKK